MTIKYTKYFKYKLIHKNPKQVSVIKKPYVRNIKDVLKGSTLNVEQRGIVIESKEIHINTLLLSIHN